MTDKLNVLYCPKCGHSNPLKATRCAECGLVFPSTLPVDDLVPDAQPVISLEQPGAKAQLPLAGTIVFSIAGHDRPLFVRRQPEIVLGRSAPGEPSPTIDLTPYHGQKMGVSRRHVVIRFEEKQATIEDLGSVNGTWINENRIDPNKPHPLHNGDYLRLGHLIIVVHASSIDTLILMDLREDAEKRLTTKILVNQVGPFLDALTDLQNTIQQFTGEQSTPVTIHSMNAGAKGAIHVRLSGATESLDLMRETITPWRRRHSDLLASAKLLENRDPATVLPPSQAESVQSRFYNAHQMLLQAVLERIAARKNETEIAPHRPLLTSALNTLIFSPLEMSESTVSGDVIDTSLNEDTGTRSLFQELPKE